MNKYLISYKIYRKHNINIKLIKVDTCIRKLNIKDINNISKLKNKINLKTKISNTIKIITDTNKIKTQ